MADDYEDDDLDESGDAETNSTLMRLLSSSSNSTTPEAQQYAKKILDGMTQGPGGEEGALIKSLENRAATNKEILRKARERLVAQRYPTSTAWLRASAALGAPTKTGHIGEKAGMLSEALVPFAEKQHEFNRNRDKGITDLDLASSNMDDDLMKARLELLKSRLSSSGRLNVEALRTLGRATKSSAPSGRGLSNFEKIARGELGWDAPDPVIQKRVKELANIDIKNKQASAGVDDEPMTQEDKVALAQQYGVPVLAVDPYGTMSTKRKAQAQAIDQRDAKKILDALDVRSQEARTAIGQADRFIQLNRGQPTGFVAGLFPAFSKNAQEMDSLTAEMSRKIRTPGEGSTSDFDAKQFERATFGRGKHYTANKNLAIAFKARQQNVIDLQDFLNNYSSLNGGSLQGAQQFWNQYLNENPIFDPQAPGKYKLNERRMNYRDYFRQKMGTKEPVKKAEGGIIENDESPLSAKLRLLGQGATLGFGDELEGLISNDTPNIRKQLGSEHEKDSTASTSLEMGGAALLIKGIQAARSMGMTDAAIRLIPKSELLRLAMAGAASGAMFGVGMGEGDNRLTSGLTGGAIGLAAGPLAGLATKYGLIGIGNTVARSPLRKDPTTRGDLRVMEALDRDNNVDVSGRMKDAERLKVPTTLGTSGGENLQALGKAAIQEGGDDADQLATDAARRMSGSRGRVEERINQSLKPDEYFGKMDELTDKLYTQAKPLYKTAYEAHPSIKSKKLYDILNTPSGQKAIDEADRFFADIPGKEKGPVDALGKMSNPSLEYLDKVKQGFDQLINVEEKQGPSPRGKAMRDLRKKFVEELDRQAPEYKTARAQYKGDLEMRDALQMGREEFNRSTPEEIRRAVKDMSFAERDAYRSGIAQRLFEVINAPAGDYNAAHRIIASPATSAKLEAVFEKPGEFKIFKSALERELEEFAKTKDLASTAGGARLARASNDPSLIGKLGSTLEAMPYRSSVLANTWNFLRLRPDMSEDTANQVAKTLKTANPKEARDYLRRLTIKSKASKRLKSRAGKAGLAVGALTGVLTSPNPEGHNMEEMEEVEE